MGLSQSAVEFLKVSMAMSINRLAVGALDLRETSRTGPTSNQRVKK